MNENKTSNTFRSYVDIEQQQQDVSGDRSDLLKEILTPKLLPGEAVVAEAQNVLMLTPFSNHKQGISGSLSVTNFKLSFITTDVNKKNDYGYQQNILLGEHEVSLSNIDVVYQILRTNQMRRLLPGVQLTGKVKGLRIVCKNMKVLTFMFKLSPVGHGKNVTQAILHHAFPRRHQLLFAYDYQEVSYFCPHNVCLFQDQHDWLAELKRTKCRGWRISSVNCNFRMSPYLPQHLVIPMEVSDQIYMNASKQFQGNFPPVWCWGTSTGAALLRMADIDPSITERDQENIMLEKVRRSHPKQQQPYVIDLHVLPSPKDVQNSFTKFRELCTPEKIEQFWIQDNHFFSQLDASKWLQTVSGCLKKSAEAAVAIEEGLTVVLQEGDGRDMAAVVSSLAQIILDSSWRTIVGFQSLVQKEWVALGHPFCKRLSHINGYENEQSPIFLVFLDCVWQLLQQFPAAFEFTETYLTTLWDSTHVGVFDTFLFDCEQDRKIATQDRANPLQLRSIWDWEEQFSPEDIALFKNPLFGLNQQMEKPSLGVSHPLAAHLRQEKRKSLVKIFAERLLQKRLSISNSLNCSISQSSLCRSQENHVQSTDTLDVEYSLPFLQLWKQCYFRWMPVLETIGGGQPQVNFQIHILVEEITYLQQKLLALQKGYKPPSPTASYDIFNETQFTCNRERMKAYLKSNPNSFFPFSHGRPDQCQEAISKSIEVMLQNSFLDDMFDSQSLMNAPD